MKALPRLLMATSLAACPFALPGAVSAEDLIVGFTLDADTLDPANHRKWETETIIRSMYDGLLTRDAKMLVVPEIAESMTQVSATEDDFKLRPGVLGSGTAACNRPPGPRVATGVSCRVAMHRAAISCRASSMARGSPSSSGWR